MKWELAGKIGEATGRIAEVRVVFIKDMWEGFHNDD